MKYNCEFLFGILFIVAAPDGETIHVGLSDSEYTYANETMRNEITKYKSNVGNPCCC